jgi:hypothetical protein
MDAISGTVGNYAHKELKDSLNRATKEMLNKKKASPNKPVEVESTKATPVVAVAVPVQESKESIKTRKAAEEAEKNLAALKVKAHKITAVLQWYNTLLDALVSKASVSRRDAISCEEEKKSDDDNSAFTSTLPKKPTLMLTNETGIDLLCRSLILSK